MGHPAFYGTAEDGPLRTMERLGRGQIGRSGCACTPAFGRAVRVGDPVVFMARLKPCPSELRLRMIGLWQG